MSDQSRAPGGDQARTLASDKAHTPAGDKSRSTIADQTGSHPLRRATDRRERMRRINTIHFEIGRASCRERV